MPIPFIIQLVIGVGLAIIGYLLMPKPKPPKPPAAKDQDSPTAESGRPIPVVWGSMNVDGMNLLWYGDKGTKTREVDAGGGKK